jgi:MYXO-CTERM domain-containing protein
MPRPDRPLPTVAATSKDPDLFRARYLVLLPWKGKVACTSPRRGFYDRPTPAHGAPKIQAAAAYHVAHATKRPKSDVSTLLDPKVESNKQHLAALAPPPRPPPPPRQQKKAAPKAEPEPETCGCTAAGATPLGLVLLLMVLIRRPRRVTPK